jgi:periplasmic protein TonB
MTAAPAAANSAPMPSGLAKSLALHGALLLFFVGYQYWNNRQRDRFGDPTSLGASAGVTAVAQIPIPRRQAPVNKVANDTESLTPSLPKPQPKTRPQREPEDPNAIALKKRPRKTQPEPYTPPQTYRPEPPKPNQVYTPAGQAAVSPLFGVTGSGGVGTSAASPFGNRFGWYEKLLRERVGQKWRTEDVDQRLKTLPACIVSFVIAKNGNVSGVKVIQSSGNYALDQSAQRAVYEASPLPPLPDGFERNTANIEFWFELKR